MNEERRYRVWWLGLPDIGEIVAATTPGRAKYIVLRMARSAGFDARFPDMRCRLVRR